jgi:outer membrane protein assembly factor BamB
MGGPRAGLARIAACGLLLCVVGTTWLAGWTFSAPVEGPNTVLAGPGAAGHRLPACPGADWPTYMGSVTRQDYAPKETALDPAGALHLALRWNFSTGSDVSASAAIVGGVAYIGSHNGYLYALNAATGAMIWKSFLGVDTDGARPNGISSSATVSKGVVYVGGGNASGQASVFALSASNGTPLWNVSTGAESHGYYVWASPLLVGSRLYVGVSSKGDNPLVYGGLLEISTTTHQVLHFFNTTAPGGIGASIWTSPAYASAAREVYVTTGNPGANGSHWAQSILALGASSLKRLGNWTVPANQTIFDGDFGATPVLYTSGAGRPMVVATDKNGYTYAWAQGHLDGGPVWSQLVSNHANLTPSPNLGPVAWSPGRVYGGATNTNVGGRNYTGAVRAFNDSTGRLLWQRAEPNGSVLGAPLYAEGSLIVGVGPDLQVLNASTGSLLYQYRASGVFQGPAAVSHGEIIAGASNGEVYAFGLASCRTAGPAGTVPSDGGVTAAAPAPATPSARREGPRPAAPIGAL